MKLFRSLLGKPDVWPEEEAYDRLVKKGFAPAAVLDIGACVGEWTGKVRQFFDAPVLMVEPRLDPRGDLMKRVGQLKDVTLKQAVLSDRAGDVITFYEMGHGSSILPERSNVPRSAVEMTTETLDDIVAEAGLAEPFLLKIDVQGSELKVLEGGRRTLEASEVVQLEVAVVPYNEGAPEIVEVLNWMDARGFVPYDVAGLIRPPGDDLAQIEMLFVKRGSPLRRTFFEY